MELIVSSFDISIESVEGGPYLAEDDQQPFDVGPVGDAGDVQALQQQVRDYLHDLPSFEQVVLRLYHPLTHPLLRTDFLPLEKDLSFAEGELVHQDQVEADADAEDIALLVIEVLLVEV